MNAVRSLLIALALPALTALAGCSGESTSGAESSETGGAASASAFRVRADFDAPLNADAGWAGAIDQAVTVNADQPFRIRFEAEADGGADTPMRLALHYRRNGGDWIDVEAHDFPYPSRELVLDFARAAIGTQPAGWRLAQSNDGTLAMAMVGGEPALLARAGDAPLIALYAPPRDLAKGFAFSARLRLPAPADGAVDSGVSLLFGYLDPDNHLRATLDPRGVIRIGRVVDGAESILDEREADVVAERWLEIEVQYEQGVLAVNFEDDRLEYSVPIEGGAPAEEFGFRVPAGVDIALQRVVFEGEPSTPRVSIVTTPAYESHAATMNLLAGSQADFVAGEGISLAERTAPWQAGNGHGEFEWALVIRRFADGAVTNETGDRFAFRLVTADGAAQAGSPPTLRASTATVTLQVPDGHLGGTFVETPGRIGPWQASNGDLYFIMEPAESDNLFMMMRSTDEGRGWHEVDGANRPATGDLESVDGRLVDGTLHILHQVTESTRYHVFRTSDHPSAPDSWALTDELATTVSAVAQMATLVVRSDGSIVTVHLGDTLGYSIRSPDGSWSDEIIIDAGTQPRLAGPQAILGRDDTMHLAYVREDGTIHYRRLFADGTLTPALQLASGAGTSRAEYGAVLPLVYIPETDTLVIAYRLGDGQLYERRVIADASPTAARQITDRPVITDAVDAQQPAADLVNDGSTLHILFIDPETRSIHHSCINLTGDAGWQASKVLVDGILGSWVRGAVRVRGDGEKVLGYVHDAGSFGGAGMNRYAALSLDVGCG